MAKSLRSKWARKMRAVKRVRYEEKELKRLNEMLTKAGELGPPSEMKSENEDENMVDGDNEVVELIQKPPRKIAVPSKRLSRLQRHTGKINPDTTKDVEEDDMTVDPIERVFNKRTMRDQYGNYPDWMNKRKMRTQQKKNKRLKRKAIKLKKK